MAGVTRVTGGKILNCHLSLYSFGKLGNTPTVNQTNRQVGKEGEGRAEEGGKRGPRGPKKCFCFGVTQREVALMVV